MYLESKGGGRGVQLEVTLGISSLTVDPNGGGLKNLVWVKFSYLREQYRSAFSLS